MTQINGHRTLVSALDAAWAAIQHQHTDVPGVVLTLGSGAPAVTAGEQRPGHFAACHYPERVPELKLTLELAPKLSKAPERALKPDEVAP